MIVMQYSFTLPADYDMDIIERRIRDNGARLDHYPGLVFKMYLFARRDDATCPSQDNLYAPLYIWEDAHSLQQFLSCAGFTALTQSFGWPTIDTWHLSSAPCARWVKQQSFAQRRIRPIMPHSALPQQLAPSSTAPNDVHAWSPDRWRVLDVTLGTTLFPSAPPYTEQLQHYRIGYTAIGAAASLTT